MTSARIESASSRCTAEVSAIIAAMDSSDDVQSFSEKDGSHGGWFMIAGEDFGSSIAEDSRVDVQLLKATEQLDRLSTRLAGTNLFQKLDSIENDIESIGEHIESLFQQLEGSDQGSFIDEITVRICTDLSFDTALISIYLQSNVKVSGLKARLNALMISMDELESTSMPTASDK